MTNWKRTRLLLSVGIAACLCVGSSSVAGPPTLAPGGLVVIAENVVHDGSWRAFYVPAGGGAAQTLGTLTFGPDADLPPSIRSSWFDDRLEMLVSDGSQMVAYAPFGGGASEDLGAWATAGGAPFVGVSSYDDSLLAFENPVIAFENPVIARRVALWETSWVTFENPVIAFGTPYFPVTFDVPVLQVLANRLQMIDMMDDSAVPIPVPGTESLGTIVAAGMFPPGSVATDPQPDIPGHPAIGLIAGDGNDLFTLYGIWGTNGTAYDGVDGESYDGVDGEAIWGTSGTAIPITQGGLMAGPTSMMAFPGSEWLGTAFTIVVLDNGSGMRMSPRVIGVRPNGDQDLIAEGGLLVAPADLCGDTNGTIIVADPEASGGDGAIIGVDPLTGAQSVLVQGGVDVGLRRPIAVGMVRCAPPTFLVNSTSDFVDPIPGDGDPSDGLGNVCLRSAIMEANASPCAGGMIIELPVGTLPLGLAGASEDGCASGDLDVNGYVRICGRGPGVTVIDAQQIDRVFDVRPGGTLVLANLTVAGGQVSGNGAGVSEDDGLLVVTNVEVEQCWASGGGGGLALQGDSLVVASTIQGNIAVGNGGGVIALGSASVLTARSLIASNESGLNGGGVGAVGVAASVNMVNTTISGNRATLSGGGVLCNDATVTIDHGTIAENVADAGEVGGSSGGGLAQIGGTLGIGGSIVAGNRSGPTLPQNGLGTIDTPGFMVFDDVAGFTLTGSTGSVIIGAPMMNGLADNGGPTLTHAISSQSPALDAADPLDAVEEDQRDLGRPQDGDEDLTARSDIGAYEFAPPVCPGDLDGDGDTDVLDFGIFAANFGANVGFNTGGDLDGDGDVDVLDFGVFASDFGCTP